MSDRHGSAARLILAVALVLLAVSPLGCVVGDDNKPVVAAFEEITPEGNGEINGFLSGVGSDRSVDVSGAPQAVRLFSVRWDVGTADSTFLLTTDTAFEQYGRDMSSVPTSEKAAALSKLDLDGSTTPVYVRYQSNPDSRAEDPLGYRYPVALKVSVSEAK